MFFFYINKGIIDKIDSIFGKKISSSDVTAQDGIPRLDTPISRT